MLSNTIKQTRRRAAQAHREHPLLPLRADALAGRPRRGKEQPMLWTLVVILVVLWLLGMVTAYTLNGLLHLLLVLAVVVIVIQLLQGRRPL
jgi:hypothetical protein